MKLAVLFTGGKDSSLALHKILNSNNEVRFLLCIVPKNKDSLMFHKPSLKLIKKQAELLNLKLVIRESSGMEKKELEDLRKLIRKVKDKVEGIVAGGIASSYQARRIKKICSELKLRFIAPLWNYKPEQVWEEALKNKFKIILTKISCEGLPKEFLGKIIDKGLFKNLQEIAKKYKFRIDFEGGEAETSVLYMPEFKKEIEVKYDIKSEGNYRHFLKLKKVK